jgi:hypothetical protein
VLTDQVVAPSYLMPASNTACRGPAVAAIFLPAFAITSHVDKQQQQRNHS